MNIYFSGLCGAGKTTAAKYIAQTYGLERVSEGAKLRDVARIAAGDTDRRTLQAIGEGMRGILSPLVWLLAALRDKEEDGLVIDDVRHPSDAQYLRDNGWIGVRIECPDDIRYKRLIERDGDKFDLESVERPSEHLLDGWGGFDYVISNAEDLAAFRAILDIVIRRTQYATNF